MPRYRFDPDRSRLTIDGRSSVHGITATAEGVVGWIETDDDGRPVTGHLTVEVDGLHTGNPLYDREIRNRLGVKTFPTFEAHLTTVQQADGPEGSHQVTGSVSAHGAQNDLVGTIMVEPDGSGVRVSGSEDIDFRQFGLKAPRLLTLKVDPIVTVTLEAVTGTADPADSTD
jgi:polyisoprenoid-binding protein YceI